jgi:hypothetical protein
MNIGVMMINKYKKNNKERYKIKCLFSLFYIELLKDDRDQKEQEKLQRKQEIQKLLEQEEAAVAASKPKTKPDLAPKKVTQAQIQQQQQVDVAAAPNVKEPKRNNLNDHQDLPLEENINRLQIDGSAARNVDDAIHVLQ